MQGAHQGISSARREHLREHRGIEEEACRVNNNVLCLSFLPGFWGADCLPQGDTGQNVRSCWLDQDTLVAAGSF